MYDKNFVLRKIDKNDCIRLQNFSLKEEILEKGFFTISDVVSAGQISFSPGELPEFVFEYYDTNGIIVVLEVDVEEPVESAYAFPYDNDLPLYLDDLLE